MTKNLTSAMHLDMASDNTRPIPEMFKVHSREAELKKTSKNIGVS